MGRWRYNVFSECSEGKTCRHFVPAFFARLMGCFAMVCMGRVRCAHQGMCGLAGARSPDEIRDSISSSLSSVLTVPVSPPGESLFPIAPARSGQQSPQTLPAIRPFARSLSTLCG